ncbi:uncharacterized protein LOC124421809 isoform X2 [Vespa crabro]|uniref:uncharacterized protein LOC124421809 isoform X2 n=1 Tax=Vespa crabro TaxID=7445 RepID=UPI001F00DBAE|nr:uncharacterized protein LOC124421809 isoform X2 [Vespa crabro]
MILTIIFYVTLIQFIEVIVSHDNLEDVTESLFMIFTYFALCFKCLNFLLRKEKLLILLNLFRENICRPRNLTEEKILDNYSRRAKWCTLSFMTLCQSSAVVIIAIPIMEMHHSTRALPCRAYSPYSIEGLHAYLATYLIHAASIIYGILINISLDSLVYGLTLHVCGQIDILCERCMQTVREA